MSGVICCIHCGQLACVVCDDAHDHLGAEHCSDPRCIAKCAQCTSDQADDLVAELAADIDLERCEWGPTA